MILSAVQAGRLIAKAAVPRWELHAGPCSIRCIASAVPRLDTEMRVRKRLPDKAERAIRIRNLARRKYKQQFGDSSSVPPTERPSQRKFRDAFKIARRKATPRRNDLRQVRFKAVQQLVELLYKEEDPMKAYAKAEDLIQTKLTSFQRQDVPILNLWIRLAWRADKGKVADSIFVMIGKSALHPHIQSYRAMFSGAAHRDLSAQQSGKLIAKVKTRFPQMIDFWHQAYESKTAKQSRNVRRKPVDEVVESTTSEAKTKIRVRASKEEACRELLDKPELFCLAYEDYLRFLFSIGQYDEAARELVRSSLTIKGLDNARSGIAHLSAHLSARILDRVSFIGADRLPKTDDWLAGVHFAERHMNLYEDARQTGADYVDMNEYWKEIKDQSGSSRHAQTLLRIRDAITRAGRDKAEDEEISDEEVRRMMINDLGEDLAPLTENVAPNSAKRQQRYPYA